MVLHTIAQELNAALRGTVVDGLLSDIGRRMFFPRGIVAQAGEAARANVRYNATQGIATVNGIPYVLPSVSRHYTRLSSAEMVAYAPTGGIPSLRSRWRKELQDKNAQFPVGASTPVVTAGITHGIGIIAELFADSGDTIIIPAPYWGNYRLIFAERRGAQIQPYPLFSAHGTYNIEGLRAVLKSHTRPTLLCVCNFPHNPTGYTPTCTEVEQIVDALVACAERGVQIAVLCDDAYFGLQYEEGLMRDSLFCQLASSHRNILAIKLDGATKEEFAWGFRVGFMTCASKELEKKHRHALEQKILGAIRSTVSNCNAAAQHIIHSALDSETHAQEKEYFFNIIRTRYREVQRVLGARTSHPRINPLPFNSGYFVTLRCEGMDTERLRVLLLAKSIGIVAVDAEHIRVTYSTISVEEIAPVFDAIFACADLC